MGKRDRSVAVASLGAVLGVALMGCLFGRSEESVRSEFEAYVKGASSCTAASECVLVGGACPLACFAAVRGDRAADVEAKTRELVSEYERGGGRCSFDCISPGPLRCLDGHCNADYAPSSGSGDAAGASGGGGAGGGG